MEAGEDTVRASSHCPARGSSPSSHRLHQAGSTAAHRDARLPGPEQVHTWAPSAGFTPPDSFMPDVHSEPDLSQAKEWVMGALLVSGLNSFLWKQRNAACKPGPKEPGWPCLGEPPGTGPESAANSTQRPPRASGHPCPGKKFQPH